MFRESFHLRVRPQVGKQEPWVQAMEMYDEYFKRDFHTRLSASATRLESDIERDISKVNAIDRQHATHHCGIAFVRGFDLQRGTIACSVPPTTRTKILWSSDAQTWIS
jgi:adenine deaminase